MPEHINKRLVSYASILEEKTREQAVISSRMPFIFPHIALMPDAHLGKGATVGSVIPTDGAIMPAAVGVDIGCGMNWQRTNIHVDEIAGKDLSKLRLGIEAVVPLSPGNYNKGSHNAETDARIAWLESTAGERGIDPDKYASNWRNQLGSLGGGNHFIEISVDQDGYVSTFLHSGSRGVGNKIAQHHIRVAGEVAEQYWINLPHPDLAYLAEDTPEFWSYIDEMSWAQEFATENRAEMESRVLDVLFGWSGIDYVCTESVSCHHNYTNPERHFGRDVWLSRKGAIDAHEGVLGLIPGSMGDRSYVVVGKGDPVSLHSAPHGAGRVYSRSSARRQFTQDDLRARMAGIEYRDDAAFIDEIPDAYKPIDQVMADASSLVEVKHELRQLVNVKGK